VSFAHAGTVVTIMIGSQGLKAAADAPARHGEKNMPRGERPGAAR
jgi:hypothetical protein